MDMVIDYMDNNTLNIQLDTLTLPLLADCGILTASAPFTHADRTLDFNVMICVMQGAIYVTEEDTDYAVCENEVLFLKCGLHHFGRQEIPKGTRWFYAHFYTQESKLPLSEESEQGEYSFYLPKKAEVDKRYFDKLSRLCEVFSSSDPVIRMKKNAALYDILTLLLQTAAPKTLSDKICAFLETQTDRSFTRALIEQEFYLSYSYMAAVFAKEKGMSPGSWHNKARMKKACELLRSTDMSIGETAAVLGFDDALYFSRKFRQKYGVSPAGYRKKALERY